MEPEDEIEVQEVEDQQDRPEPPQATAIPKEMIGLWLTQAREAAEKLQKLQVLQEFQDLPRILKAIESQIHGKGSDSISISRAGSSVRSSRVSLHSEFSVQYRQYPRTIIPQNKYVSWKRAASHGRLEGVYHVIYIPFDEPTSSDIIEMRAEGWVLDNYQASEEDERESEIPDHYPTYREGLPERIRIHSLRLKSFLNHEFGNSHLNLGQRYEPFSFLRPFRFLLYFGSKLRTRVKELERELTQLEWDQNDAQQTEQECLTAKCYDDWMEDSWDLRSDTPLNVAIFMRECQCLIDFMDDHLVPEQNRLAKAPSKVKFVDLFFVFPQGSLVYTKDSKVPQKIWRVVQARGGRRFMARPASMKGEYRPSFSPMKLDCFFLDYDGSRFLPIYETFEIKPFDGEQPITSLLLVPLSVAERDLKAVNREELLHQGRQFVKYTSGPCHLDYSGHSQSFTPQGEKLVRLVDHVARGALLHSERVSSEVMVDFARAVEAIPEWQPIAGNYIYHDRENAEFEEHDISDADGQWEQRSTEEFLEKEEQKWNEWKTKGTGPTEDEDLLVLPNRVFAFLLHNRQWACLRIGKDSNGNEHLRERSLEENPWDKLQLHPPHKEVIQALVTAHFGKTHAAKVHFDLLKNKGNGLIILLHGVPGVGKTSTAECVAAHYDKPLLPITCGDLGLSPSEVEEKLKETFRLAQDWGCVLLLDEADVFLAQRRLEDMERNALVSVFLRTLEYYDGLLFLTTNRVGVFDEAFKSRIHMALYYPPLDFKPTLEIWQRHIRQAQKAGFEASTEDLTGYATTIWHTQKASPTGEVWNGRQIRNAFQSAAALAVSKSKPDEPIRLTHEDFQRVYDVSYDFSDYLWQTRKGQTDSDRSRKAMTRRDSFSSGQVNPMAFNQAMPSRDQGQQAGVFHQGYGTNQGNYSNFGQPSQPQGAFAGYNQSFISQPQQFGHNQPPMQQQQNLSMASQPQYNAQQPNVMLYNQQAAGQIQVPMGQQSFASSQTISRT
ncbi:unnamed protein product [Penicillium bialowiezense]